MPGMEGIDDVTANGWVSLVASPNSLPHLAQKAGLASNEDTVANWPDPSACWQEKPRKGG